MPQHHLKQHLLCNSIECKYSEQPVILHVNQPANEFLVCPSLLAVYVLPATDATTVGFGMLFQSIAYFDLVCSVKWQCISCATCSSPRPS